LPGASPANGGAGKPRPVRDGGRVRTHKSFLRWETRRDYPRAVPGDPGLGTCQRTRTPDPSGENESRGETPTLGVKPWIEPRKRKWSRNSARSSKALALWWWPATTA